MEVRVRVDALSNSSAQYYVMATQVIYYYDYFLTLPDEVLFTSYPFRNLFTVVQIRYAWTGRKTWGEPACNLALSILTRPVFFVFFLVGRISSTLNPF